METHLAREFGEALQRAELEDPSISVLAAREESGDWAGFVALRRGRAVEGPRAVRPIEIARFYLRSRWYGRGATQFLMGSALEVAAAAGHDGVWLQVWEQNARARRFYEKCGFVAVGTNPFRFGDVWENDIVYEHAIQRAHRVEG
jgi:GNAT superfamily N-acetyltransferase